MYLTFDQLSQDQIVHLKTAYLFRLSDEGVMNEVLFDRPEDDKDPELGQPSFSQVADADKLVPDDILRKEYGEVLFSEEDFP